MARTITQRRRTKVSSSCTDDSDDPNRRTAAATLDKDDKVEALTSRDMNRLIFWISLSILLVYCLLQSIQQASAPNTVVTENSASLAQQQQQRTTLSGSLQPKLLKVRYEAADVWNDLVTEGGGRASKNKIAMEVGMHRARQCLQAASNGMQAYCVEPSPSSFQEIKKQVTEADPEVKKRVHLYNVAAGAVTGDKVDFSAGGSTGDHVGHFDMWTMEHTIKGVGKGGEKMIQVPTARLDDIIAKMDDNLFVLKVDTQGYEPNVLKGLTESLRNHKIDFLVLEYWPRGMDALADKTHDECVGAYMLADLVAAGYTLYATQVLSHPLAPQNAPRGIANARDRPLDDLMANCKWFLDIEKRVPSSEYKLGYWTDVIAVSPKARIENPTTEFGMTMFPSKPASKVQPNPSSPFKMDLFDRRFQSGEVWRGLMAEAKAKSEKLVAIIEVGSRAATKQCPLIASQGVEAHCVAPSTNGFEALQKALIKSEPDVQALMHIYKASPRDQTSGVLQPGQPMEKDAKFHVHNVVQEEGGGEGAAPTLRLDDIVGTTNATVHLVNLAVQGEDQAALAGLKGSVADHNVDYILFDFNPTEFGKKDLLNLKEECDGVGLLKMLIESGYTLYPMNVEGPSGIAEGAPKGFGKTRDRPMTNALDHCKWYMEAAKSFPARQGFSSTMLAVSPNARIANPQSEVGMTLFPPDDFRQILDA